MRGILRFSDWMKTHRIEAFAFEVASVFFCMVILCGTILVHAKGIDRDVLTNQAVYASEFTTSLSGVKGRIEQVYTNADHTKCGILVSFNEPGRLSSDAKDYQVFIKGYNVSKGRYASKTYASPSGGYCIFGGTGYALIYLSESSGFGNQALECVVRSNNTIFEDSSYSKSSDELKEKDGSYAAFDQYRVIVNPAASEAVKVDFLDDLDPSALYKQAIVDGGEKEIRETLAADVSSMNTAMKAVLAYRDNLKNLGVRVPSLPPELAGDEFVLEEGTNQLVYTPGWVHPQGADFDWFHKDLSSGVFLDETLLGAKSAGQFFGDLRAARYESSKEMSSLNSDWSMMDGTPVDLSNDTELQDQAAIAETIKNYAVAVNEYFSLKQNYQVKDMVSYLTLEYNMNNTGSSISGNFAEGVITAW